MKRQFYFILIYFLSSFMIYSLNFDIGIKNLASGLSKKIKNNQILRIAVIEFTNLNKNQTDFGKYLAESLTTYMFKSKKFDIIERQLLDKIFTENKFALSEDVDETTVKEIGKILGVDALCTGTYTDMGNIVIVNARLIATDTGKILNTESVTIDINASIKSLLKNSTITNENQNNNLSNPEPKKELNDIIQLSRNRYYSGYNGTPIFNNKINFYVHEKRVNDLNNFPILFKDINIILSDQEIADIHNFIGFISENAADYKEKSFNLVDVYYYLKNLLKQDSKNDIYYLINNKVNIRSGYWMKYENNNKYITLFYGGDYGNLDDFNKIETGMASGWTHFIYYKNDTGKKNLYSIKMLGFFIGNPNKEFSFLIEDISGNILFKSKTYKFNFFPRKSKPLEFREFFVDLKNLPEEFIIKLDSHSNPSDSLFIINIPSTNDLVYSFEYLDNYTFKEYKNCNAAIFPKLY